MRLFFIILLGSVFFSCEDDDYPVRYENYQVIRLLTLDKHKIWYPETELTCAKDNLLIFSKAETTQTLGKYRMKKGVNLCPGESGEDIAGTWELLVSGSMNRLRVYAEDTVNYDITLLTASQMTLQTPDTSLLYIAH